MRECLLIARELPLFTCTLPFFGILLACFVAPWVLLLLPGPAPLVFPGDCISTIPSGVAALRLLLFFCLPSPQLRFPGFLTVKHHLIPGSLTSLCPGRCLHLVVFPGLRARRWHLCRVHAYSMFLTFLSFVLSFFRNLSTLSSIDFPAGLAFHHCLESFCRFAEHCRLVSGAGRLRFRRDRVHICMSSDSRTTRVTGLPEFPRTNGSFSSFEVAVIHPHQICRSNACGGFACVCGCNDVEMLSTLAF